MTGQGEDEGGQGKLGHDAVPPGGESVAGTRGAGNLRVPRACARPSLRLAVSAYRVRSIGVVPLGTGVTSGLARGRSH